MSRVLLLPDGAEGPCTRIRSSQKNRRESVVEGADDAAMSTRRGNHDLTNEAGNMNGAVRQIPY